MSRRILIVCDAVPGQGGAATSAYELFARMQRDGHDVAYLDIVNEALEARYKRDLGEEMTNPRRLPQVWSCVLRRPALGPQPGIAPILDEIAPDIVLSIGPKGACLVKAERPEIPAIFFAVGTGDLRRLLMADAELAGLGLLESLAAGARPPLERSAVLRAMQAADLVVPNSELLRTLFEGLYPEYAEKLHERVIWMAEWIVERATPYTACARPFDERDIDVLFLASRWNRIEKNHPFVRAIVDALPGRRVHLVGQLEETLQGATCHGFVADVPALMDLMGRAKVVASPSRFDAAPGILFEAAALGCNVVASGNCGNWKVCPEPLRVEAFTADAFVEAIERGLEEPLESHLDEFLAGGSYERLIRILDHFEPELARVDPRGLDLDGLREQLMDPDRGYAVVRRFLSSEEVERYRRECARLQRWARVVHRRINRSDMFDYVHPMHHDSNGKSWSVKPQRKATTLRMYQFPHNRHSPPTATLFERVLELRNRIEAPWDEDAAYRAEREELSDYVQITRFLDDNSGVAFHRDSQRDLPYPVVQPFVLLTEPSLDFDGGDLLIRTHSGRTESLIAGEGLHKGDLVLFDRRLEHAVERTRSSGRTGLGRWSVVVGARDRQVGRYSDRLRYRSWWVSHISPTSRRLQQLPRRVLAAIRGPAR